jgi:hypothetical protein
MLTAPATNNKPEGELPDARAGGRHRKIEQKNQQRR